MKSAVVSSLLLSLAACTGIIEEDTSTPPVTTVAVVVRDSTMPIADVNVIFQNADDSILSDARTGADGRAVIEMPNGGNVTVIRTFPPPMDPETQEQKPAEITTYVGVKAGDVLELVGELDMTRGTPNAINVKVPTIAQGTVRVTTPCGSGQGAAPTIPITVMGCPAAPIPFYVMDSDGLTFLMRAQVSENVDLSAGSFSDSLGASLSLVNKPTDIDNVTAEKRLFADGYEIASSGQKRIDQTAATIDLPDVFGVDEVLVAAYHRQTGGTQIQVTRGGYSGAGTTVLDAAAIGRLPYTSKVQVSPLGISWSEDTAMMTATGAVDFVIATVDVTRPDPTGGPYDVRFVRTIVAPHGVPNLRIPQVPDALYNPVADDSIGGSLALVSVTGGYDAARDKLFAYPSITDVAPMNGTATISYSGNAPR
jgi:hypothetical protein